MRFFTGFKHMCIDQTMKRKHAVEIKEMQKYRTELSNMIGCEIVFKNLCLYSPEFRQTCKHADYVSIKDPSFSWSKELSSIFDQVYNHRFTNEPNNTPSCELTSQDRTKVFKEINKKDIYRILGFRLGEISTTQLDDFEDMSIIDDITKLFNLQIETASRYIFEEEELEEEELEEFELFGSFAEDPLGWFAPDSEEELEEEELELLEFAGHPNPNKMSWNSFILKTCKYDKVYWYGIHIINQTCYHFDAYGTPIPPGLKADLKRERNIQHFVCNTTDFTKKDNLDRYNTILRGGFQSIVFLVCMIHGMSFEYCMNNYVFSINLALALLQNKLINMQSPLAQAAYEGKLELCAALLQAGAEIDDGGTKGWTALYIASQDGHAEICKLLLERGASIDQPMNDGCTPLYIASQQGHAEICQILLEHNASVDQPKNDGATPLFLASQEGRTEICKILLDHSASVDQPKDTGSTPLYIASRNGHAEVVKILLDHNASVDQPRVTGSTPLFIASQEGHADICKILLANHAKVDQSDNRGNTPLWIASHEGHAEICNILLERGASMDQPWYNGRPPLYVASQEGQTEICKILLECGANVDQPMNDGCTPLYIASQQGHAEICQILLEHNASVDQPKNDGATPLFLASQEGRTEICKILLDHNANVDQPMDNNITPLAVAACFGKVDCVELLLSAGAVNVEMTGYNDIMKIGAGNTPLQIAIQKGHDVIATMIRTANQ